MHLEQLHHEAPDRGWDEDGGPWAGGYVSPIRDTGMAMRRYGNSKKTKIRQYI